MPDAVDKLYAPITPDELEPLFPRDRSSLTSVSLLNTDVSRRAARSRSVRAEAIDDIAPELTDYAYVCSIAEGYTELQSSQPFRRYIGISRSRVADYKPNDGDYATYRGWLDGLIAQLRSASAGVTTLDRFAQFIPTPANTDPAHALIDVDQNRFVQEIKWVPMVPLELEQSGSDVVGGGLTIVVNGVVHQATLQWQPKTKRYLLGAPSLKDERFIDKRDRSELVTRSTANRH